MPFELRAGMGPRNQVLDGVQIPMGRGNFDDEKGRPVVEYSYTLPSAVQKRLNRSRRRLGFGLGCSGGPKEACIKWCILAPPDEYHWTVRVQRRCRPYVKLLWPLVIIIILRSWNIFFGWLNITKKDYYLNTTKHFYLDASVSIRDFHLHAEPHVYDWFLATSHLYRGKNRKKNRTSSWRRTVLHAQCTSALSSRFPISQGNVMQCCSFR